MSGAADTNTAKQQGPGSFEDTVRDFWSSRPRRPQHGRKIAGVAAALGNRYDIDPIVIRVAFVAATFFGGIGPLLYVLGWLFLPDERDEVSGFEGLIHRGRSSMSAGFAVLLCLLLLPLSGVGFSSGWFGRGNWFGGGGLIAVILFFAGLYFVHRNRGQQNRPASPASDESRPVSTHAFPSGFSVTETPATASSSRADTHEKTEEIPADTSEISRSTSTTIPASSVTSSVSSSATESIAPAWDPLGADPFAWDFPDPEPAPSAVSSSISTPVNPYASTEPRRRRSRIGLLTFGLAMLVAGVSVAIGIDAGGWFSVQHILGLVLGVLGVGMVVGAFAGGGRGLVWLAVPLAMAGVAITAVPSGGFTGGFGRIDAAPLTVAEVQPLYQKSAGSIDLDLTNLPADAVVSTEIRNGVGESIVSVPMNADVHFTCLTAAGPIRCLGHDSQGVGNGSITGEDLGPDGAGGAQITLKITNGAGDVEVHRG